MVTRDAFAICKEKSCRCLQEPGAEPMQQQPVSHALLGRAAEEDGESFSWQGQGMAQYTAGVHWQNCGSTSPSHVRFAEIWLILMFILIYCEKKNTIYSLKSIANVVQAKSLGLDLSLHHVTCQIAWLTHIMQLLYVRTDSIILKVIRQIRWNSLVIFNMIM
jgi:hypothetical protein